MDTRMPRTLSGAGTRVNGAQSKLRPAVSGLPVPRLAILNILVLSLCATAARADDTSASALAPGAAPDTPPAASAPATPAGEAVSEATASKATLSDTAATTDATASDSAATTDAPVDATAAP